MNAPLGPIPLSEAAALLQKSPAWLRGFVKRHPVDADGRHYCLLSSNLRWITFEGLKRLEKAVEEYDTRPVDLDFVKAGDCIKIGIAVDWHKRIMNLQSASPVKLRRLLVIRFFVGLEPKLHKKLADFHIRGEWIRDCPEVRCQMERFASSELFVAGEEAEQST